MLNYFWGGAIAVIASWILSGCRVGNNTVPAPTPSASPDPISGYYETQPQTLQYCATYSSKTQCGNVSPNLVPSEVSTVMTNPVALVAQNLSTGLAVFTDPAGNGKNAFPVFVDLKSFALSLSDPLPAQSFMGDATCTDTFTLTLAGTLVTSNYTSTTGTTLPLSGRVQLQLDAVTTFDPVACAKLFVTLAACYQDVTQCTGTSDSDKLTTQQSIQSVVNPYVNAGLFKGSDISGITSLAYEIIYQ